jgi:hypothetical protein
MNSKVRGKKLQHPDACLWPEIEHWAFRIRNCTADIGGMIESFRICTRHRIEVSLLSRPGVQQLVPVDARFINGKVAVIGDTI